MSDVWATIPQMVFAQAKAYGNRPVLQVKRGGISYRDITWSEFASQVEAIALALIDLGVEPGDRVAILAENRPEWATADLSILAAQAVTVPIYTTLVAEEVHYILKNSGAKFIFVSSPEMMTNVLSADKAQELKIILFDAPYRVSGPRLWWLGELMGLGRTAGLQTKEELAKRLAQAKSEELASIIYTSGTTGPPKGVMLTHGNFLSNCRAIREVIPINEKDTTLSFLPLSHVFERVAGYYFVLLVGGKIAYAENLEKVRENLLEACPTVLTGVPRFYEKIVERIREVAGAQPAYRRRIFSWALKVGQQWAKAALSGKPVSGRLALQHRIARALVFSKIKFSFGGNLRFCISGSAPLAPEVAHFFYAIGILILEGYGLTETSPVITVNRPDRFRFGSVGLPLPGVEVRVAPDGEILTRGPHIMRGYWNNPQATAEVMDADGWFHTGDVGVLSADGFLTITDRKKDLIKTSGGKMVAPQNLEASLKTDPLIADCVLIGDRRKYLTALIVPNKPAVEAYAHKHSLAAANFEALLQRSEITGLFWQRVERVNQKLASFEQIKKITLLPEPFTLSGGELTPTMKVKRRVIAERYASLIEAMYLE